MSASQLESERRACRLAAIVARVRCPETHQPLELAGTEALAALNARIAAGEVVNQGGERVSEALVQGVIRRDQRVIYPVQDGVLRLLAGRAIVLSAS